MALATTGWGVRAGMAVAAVVLGLVVLLPLMAVGAPQGAADARTLGLDPVVLDAYLNASMRAGDVEPGCAVRWSVLAAIGKVESNNTAGRVVGEDGTVVPPIVGIALDGSGGTAAIADTDDGAWDGDATWDRAVGPMQFIPSSWRAYGRDGNEDGAADPHNVYDAALGAVAHLCASALGDDTDESALRAALYSYNHSQSYVDNVLSWVAHFDAVAAGADTEAGDGAGTEGYALPLERSWFDAHPDWLTRPHHDYPASDLPVPVGTPVRAAVGGDVAAVTDPDSRCGRGVVVAGADGYQYVYCHGSTVLVGNGDAVATGQVVLLSGNSGNSTGPHLHFGVRRADGADLCPQPLLTAWYHGTPVTPLVAPTSGCIS